MTDVLQFKKLTIVISHAKSEYKPRRLRLIWSLFWRADKQKDCQAKYAEIWSHSGFAISGCMEASSDSFPTVIWTGCAQTYNIAYYMYYITKVAQKAAHYQEVQD